MRLLMSGREEDKIEEGRGWLEEQSHTQRIQGSVDSGTKPERSFLSKVLNQVKAQLLISEGKEDAKVPSSVLIRACSTVKYRVPSVKAKRIDRDGQFEAVHQYLTSRLRLPDCEVEGQQLRSSELSTCTRRSRRPINEGDMRMDEIMANEDGQLEVTQQHLAQGFGHQAKCQTSKSPVSSSIVFLGAKLS
ncbi:hypothetical protein BKA82DRAFT_4014104 [Pisolithus tinctorius]|nr:hypothetical protein BKA82DRAFT_4014104 [Pisolithus tinctorius]